MRKLRKRVRDLEGRVEGLETLLADLLAGLAPSSTTGADDRLAAAIEHERRRAPSSLHPRDTRKV
jgi:hypothetical protein